MGDTPLNKHPSPPTPLPRPSHTGIILQTCLYLAPAMGTVPTVLYDKYRESRGPFSYFYFLHFTFIIFIINHTILIITFLLSLSLYLCYLTSSLSLAFYQSNIIFMTLLSSFILSIYTYAYSLCLCFLFLFCVCHFTDFRKNPRQKICKRWREVFVGLARAFVT